MAEVVVLGAGVIGLTTARELLRRGHRVTVVARDLPMATTSAIAAAIWYPYLAAPRERVLDWCSATYTRLVELAGDPATGVLLQPTVELLPRGAALPHWAAYVPGSRFVGEGVLHTVVPVADTRRYLPWLAGEVQRLGAAIEQRTVARLDDAFAVAPVVVNCTGLGAKELCADQRLVPIRGQVLYATGVQAPMALIDDRTEVPVYVVPRGDQVVLGGTAQPGAVDLTPDPADTARIVADCRARMPELAAATIVAERVGLRPWRPEVRLNAEPRGPGRLVVHCYGHGGSGFTLSYGCAAEVCTLVP